MFKFLAKGRSEAYGPRGGSEGTRIIGPRLANNGRRVAMEAAMIPRFISSLKLFSAVIVDEYAIIISTHMAKMALVESSSGMTVRANIGKCIVCKDLQVTSAELLVYRNPMRRTEKDAVLDYSRSAMKRFAVACLFPIKLSGTYINPSPMSIESRIFNDFFIWSFRITKKGKPAQVKSVNMLIARLSSEMSRLVWRENIYRPARMQQRLKHFSNNTFL